MDRARLERIRNWQSDDWYAALVIRPLAIAAMLVVADWRWLTPNLVTTLGNACKLIAVVLIVGDDRASAWWWAAGLLQLGLLLDNLDGTIARYRRTFSVFGSVYDKVSDVVTWFAISLALGWRAYLDGGDALLIVLATTSAFALAVRGYMKWLLVAEAEKLRWLEALDDPAAAAAQRTGPPRFSTPPARTARDWVRWFAKMSIQVYRFEEVDLFFWVGLGLVLGELEKLIWLLFVSQVLGCVGMLIWRHLEAVRLDRALRARRARLPAWQAEVRS
jgi:phosphatidylglycerophosphate synthase